MVFPKLKKSWHREYFAQGLFDKIPPASLEALKAEAAEKEAAAKAEDKPEKKENKSKGDE